MFRIFFRMNTCKSVSKQRTLTPFGMNIYKKHRGVRQLLLTRKWTRIPVLNDERFCESRPGRDHCERRLSLQIPTVIQLCSAGLKACKLHGLFPFWILHEGVPYELCG